MFYATSIILKDNRGSYAGQFIGINNANLTRTKILT
jgi:hypothetical protein